MLSTSKRGECAMKSTGVIRHVDALGRVVIPKSLRRSFEIEHDEPVEVFVSDDLILLRKYSPGCFLCGEVESVKIFKGKKICQGCIDQIS